MWFKLRCVRLGYPVLVTETLCNRNVCLTWICINFIFKLQEKECFEFQHTTTAHSKQKKNPVGYKSLTGIAFICICFHNITLFIIHVFYILVWKLIIFFYYILIARPSASLVQNCMVMYQKKVDIVTYGVRTKLDQDRYTAFFSLRVKKRCGIKLQSGKATNLAEYWDKLLLELKNFFCFNTGSGSCDKIFV